MAEAKCSNPNCTVAQTGKCLESHDNVRECPNYSEAEDLVNEEIDAALNSLSSPDFRE